MQLNEQTIKVLKNFSGINQSIFINAGKKLQTMVERTNILAEYEGEDEFPIDCAIYDLIPFLGAVALFPNPNLDFQDSFVTISGNDGKAACRYFYADPSVVTNIGGKSVKISDWEISFSLLESVLKEALQVSNVLNLPHLSVIGKDGQIKLMVHDNALSNSNNWEVAIKEWTGEDFSHTLRISYLKIIPGNYDIQISSKGVSKWENSNMNLRYFISLEVEK